jgi:hypothetical protein
MHRISGRPDNPAFFDIRYPAGYQIALPDIRLMFGWSNNLFSFSSYQARKKNFTKINLVSRSCFVYCLQKSIIIKAVFINLFDIFLKNIVAKLRIRPDIRYPALTGYPVSGFWNSRISGKTVSGASLILLSVSRNRIRSDPDFLSGPYYFFWKDCF